MLAAPAAGGGAAAGCSTTTMRFGPSPLATIGSARAPIVSVPPTNTLLAPSRVRSVRNAVRAFDEFAGAVGACGPSGTRSPALSVDRERRIRRDRNDRAAPDDLQRTELRDGSGPIRIDERRVRARAGLRDRLAQA